MIAAPLKPILGTNACMASLISAINDRGPIEAMIVGSTCSGAFPRSMIAAPLKRTLTYCGRHGAFPRSMIAAPLKQLHSTPSNSRLSAITDRGPIEAPLISSESTSFPRSSIAAPLKLSGSLQMRPGRISAINDRGPIEAAAGHVARRCDFRFPRSMIAAPLKLPEYRLMQPMSRAFRDQLIAAPLKPDVMSTSRLGISLSAITDRGPIEACASRQSVRGRYFPRSMIAAPLKLRIVACCDHLPVVTFRDQLIAAPLKRISVVQSRCRRMPFPRSLIAAPLKLGPSAVRMRLRTLSAINDRGPIEASCSARTVDVHGAFRGH